MSLPSSAWFIKNGLIVGRVFCNCGWSLNGAILINTAWRAWHDAKELFDKGLPPEVLVDEGETDWYKQFTQWYTTREDLLSFDSVYLYDNILPRDVYEATHRNPACTPKLAELADKGMYKDVDKEFQTAVTATKIARGIA